MPQQVPDIKLSGVVLDGPGRKSVPEAVRVDLLDAGLPAKSTQHLLQAIWLKADAVIESAMSVRGVEEGAGLTPPASKVIHQLLLTNFGERDNSLIVTFSESDRDSSRLDVQVLKI